MQMSRSAKLAAVLLGWLSIAPFATANVFPHSGVAGLSAGGYHTCAVLADHRVVCWGAETVGTPTLIQGITTAVSVTSGYDFACALLLDHTVACWGDNSLGQLGDGTTTSRYYPAPTDNFGSVAAIAAGENHVCALLSKLSNGWVYCWGSNSKGQLGNWALPVGDDVYSPHPIYVAWKADDGTSIPLNAADISAGSTHTCAHQNMGIATYCWGNNSSGQLGIGWSPSYWEVPEVVGFWDARKWVTLSMAEQSVTSGSIHTCGLVPDGGPAGLNINSIACWGTNHDGAIGNPIGDHTVVPVAVLIHPDMSGHSIKFYDINKLSAGGNFTCALELNSALQCWGRNDYGQLGNASYTDASSQWPVVHSLTWGFTDVSTGAAHACALRNGNVVCWGSNLLGQLGVSSLDNNPHYDAVTAAVDAPIFTDNFDNN